MSSFIAEKLDIFSRCADTFDMGRRATPSKGSSRVMAFVRQQIERGGERLWRLDDFRNTAPGRRPSARAGRTQPQSRSSPHGAKAFSLRESPPPIFSDSRHRRRDGARFPPAPSACPANSSAATPSFIRAGRKHGPAFPRVMRRCSISCAAREELASSRRKKPSAAPSSFCLKKDASSACSGLRLPSPRASAR